MNSSSKSTNLKRVWRLSNGASLCLWQPVDGQSDDQRILNTVKQLTRKVTKDNKEIKITLISKKPSFRLMASSQGIYSEDFNDVGSFRNNDGYNIVNLNDDEIQQITNQPDNIIQSVQFNNLPINSYILPAYNNEICKGSIYRYIGNNEAKMINRKPHCCGILPKNAQQCMAIDALMNDDIPFVTLLAKAGTGKTLLAIASAMHKVLVQKKYRKIVITRPIVPIGRDIGYLPGDLDDKMEEWLLPFWNNIQYISAINLDASKRKFSKEKIDMLLDKEKRSEILQILPISFMRGSSISNSYIIIDEAQNTTPSQMKTIITRIGLFILEKMFDLVAKLPLIGQANTLLGLIAGAAKGSKSSVMITLGTGVGGGIIIDGKIYSGFNGCAGELGHIVIEKGGAPCSCGRLGCWEAYSSATGLIRMTKEKMEECRAQGRKTVMEEMVAAKGKVSGRTAFDAMRAGDAAGKEVVDKYISYLATGLTDIVNIFQPEVLSIGGGLSGERDTLLAPLVPIVNKEKYGSGTVPDTKICIAELGNDAGIIGAAFLGI